NLDDYLQSRAVGSEKDATDNDRKKKRAEAIEANQLTVEVFDEECAASPKSLFVDAESALAESLLALTRLDQYHRETYGEEDKAPSLVDLQKGLEEIHEVVEFLLNERRKTEPDPAPVVEESPQEEEHQESDGRKEELEPMGKEPKRRVSASGPLRQISDAYALVVESAEYLFDRDPKSPVPYLVCASLRLGETRMQGPTPSPGFAVGPSSETRQSLRNLATKGSWNELMRASLPILASECARGWLDLHRYVWRAGQETGANAISTAVVGTLKSLLTTQSEIRYWTLEDDTGAANPETQHWLDTVVFGGARSEISGPGAS
ncbi:MAG: type VI secretion system domain-containing protein, partial [Candidatus Acidiferrales bacterium]